MKYASLALALSFTTTAAIAGVYQVDINCTAWQTKAATFDPNGTAHYTLAASCNIDEQVPEFYKGYPLAITVIGASLQINATYQPSDGKATEVAVLNGTYYSTYNTIEPGAQKPLGPISPNTMQTISTCKQDPFATPVSVFADCTPPQRSTVPGPNVAPWPWGGDSVGTGGHTPLNVVPFFDNHAMPVFLASHKVDPRAVSAAKLTSAEEKLTAPVVLSPKAQQKFYSQDVRVQPQIPASYKQMNQICCQLELQKSDGNRTWLPPLTINKPNVDVNNWTIAFADFAPLGYGWYRLRVAPLKYGPLDTAPWSDYVEFAVWPKEVLEVPKFATPSANASYTGFVPVSLDLPSVAVQAGLHCCELDVETLKNNVWTTLLDQQDPRLDQKTGIRLDAKALGASDVRLRARFIPAPANQQPQWTSWVQVKVQ